MYDVIVPDEVEYEGGCNFEIGGESVENGKIYIANNRIVLFLKENLGFDLDHRLIVLYAKQGKSLYLQYKDTLEISNEKDGENSTDDSDDDCGDGEEEFTEISVLPHTPVDLQRMYDAVNKCQLLHPASDDSDDGCDNEMMQQIDEEDDGQFDDVITNNR